MISINDFSMKQIVFVFFNEGEKISFSNDNLIVKNKEDRIKFQCTCYRLFVVYAIGSFSITTPLIQKSKQFGFFIALCSPGFRLYQIIGASKDGNTLLKRKQYQYMGLDIAKHLVRNKIATQYKTLKNIRNKQSVLKEDMNRILFYYHNIDKTSELKELMAFEGLSAKLYFKHLFESFDWKGRKPRIKNDIINSTLDIGYTLLFSFVETILECFGFDTYVGVLHRQFYMRKSLVCDIIEPFRTLIDCAIKNAYNLKQIKESDFLVKNNQHFLKWEKNSEYVTFLMKPIIEKKETIFLFIQQYYRCFMKEKDIDEFPSFVGEEIVYGPYKL